MKASSKVLCVLIVLLAATPVSWISLSMSSVPVLPPAPKCAHLLPDVLPVCISKLAAWRTEYDASMLPVWIKASLGDIARSLGLLDIFTSAGLIFAVSLESTGLELPSWMLKVPRVLRLILLPASFVLVLGFLSFAWTDINSVGPGGAPSPTSFLPYGLGNLIHRSAFGANAGTFGETAFALLALASVLMVLYWSGDGVLLSVGRSLCFVAAPPTVFLTLGLILFEAQTANLAVSMFIARLSYLAFLTNWFCLFASLEVLVLGVLLVRKRHT